MSARRYFETFDALRFIAFFIVFVSHSQLKNLRILDFFANSGGYGVSFFFVLSGFLITYILLYEKQNSSQFNAKKFFMRRILRIWPLFYLMILFAWSTPYILELISLQNSDSGYEPNWFMSLFFLENYQMIITNEFPNVSPLGVMWTLCIEEHFYILWGILFYFIPTKHTPNIIVLSILTAIISRLVYTYFSIPFLDLFSNLDFFAYGAIPAYLLISKSRILNQIESIPKNVKYAITLATLWITFQFGNMSFLYQNMISPILLGVLFSLVICMTLSTSNQIRISRNSVFSRLGKYTYGLYLFHTICILFVNKIENKLLLFENDYLQIIFITILSLAFSITISMISYHSFEKRFLKLKRYFQ